jgi:dTDP-4-dehydrorhamnose reductase
MKVWVIGAGGMLGSAFLDLCHTRGIAVVGTAQREADICIIEQLREKAREICPTHIVNCAAYTNVDRAEAEPERAFAVNGEGAANVARVAKEWDLRLIHISTDYVFDGKGTVPYREEAICAPCNVYGMSKWEGEKKVAQLLPHACIVRTSWLFGAKGKNFISSLWDWFQQKEELQVVDDQRGRPTWCKDLAEAILHLKDAEGIVHFANEGESSRYQIALELLGAAQRLGIPVRCQRVLPVSGVHFPTIAPRPAYSVLATPRYVHLTTQQPRPFGEAIMGFLGDVHK